MTRTHFNQVLDRLEGDYLARGRRNVLETLQPLLLDRKGDRPYAELGAALAWTSIFYRPSFTDASRG